jgi:hypothetical protein
VVRGKGPGFDSQQVQLLFAVLISSREHSWTLFAVSNALGRQRLLLIEFHGQVKVYAIKKGNFTSAVLYLEKRTHAVTPEFF